MFGAPWIAVDPEDPSTVFMPSSWGSIMRLQVDVKTKTWKVRSIHHQANLADGLVQGHNNAVIMRAIRHDGTLYLVNCGSPFAMLRVDDSTNNLVPVMCADFHMSHDAHLKHGPVRAWAGENQDSYVWTDGNGDGRPQREEVQFFPGGPWVGLTEWDAGGLCSAGPEGAFQRWPITGWNAVKAPILANFPLGKPLLPLPARVTAIEPRWGSYVTKDPQPNSGWYAAINNAMPDWGTSKDSFVIAYNADGTQRWITGGKTIGTPQAHLAPGDIGCFRRIAGLTHGCVVLNDFMEGAWPLTSYVWDHDGLWVGGVMDEIERKAAPVWRYGAGAEALGTTLVNDPKTGDVLLYWHGYNDVRIGKVTGWDGWVRSAGSVKLTAVAPSSVPSPYRDQTRHRLRADVGILGSRPPNG